MSGASRSRSCSRRWPGPEAWCWPAPGWRCGCGATGGAEHDRGWIVTWWLQSAPAYADDHVVAVSVQRTTPRDTVSIECRGCGRSAATDAVPRDMLLELIGWRPAGKD